MNDQPSLQHSSASCSVDEWDQFLESKRPEIGHKQYIWWAEFQRQRGYDRFGIVARNDGAVCGGASVLIKSFAPGICYYYIPHGPVLPKCDQDAAELFDQVIAYVDDQQRNDPNQVSHLRLEPRWQLLPPFVKGFRQAADWNEPRTTLCIDLTLSDDQILSQMKKKGRYNIGVARRHGVTVVEDTTAQGLSDFVSLYKSTTTRQGIKRHSTMYFERLATTLFAFGRGSILFAQYRGKRIAAALVIYSGDTATYKYGGSLDVDRHVMAPYLLQFQCMRAARDAGCKWYDFYGVSPRHKPVIGWANFSDFKRKFGGCELNFVPALDLVFDPLAYQQYLDQLTP